MCIICITNNTIELKMLNVRVGEELEERLNVLARETGRTKTFYVKEALEKYMLDAEDIYLAESRLEDLATGRSRTYTIQEVRDQINAGKD